MCVAFLTPPRQDQREGHAHEKKEAQKGLRVSLHRGERPSMIS